MKLSETALTKQILQHLAWQRNVMVWRQNTGAAKYSYTNKAGITKDRFVEYGFPGISDIIGMCDGRFLAIEVKVGKNDQSLQQKEFERSVKAHGGLFILAYSLEDVVNALRAEGMVE